MLRLMWTWTKTMDWTDMTKTWWTRTSTECSDQACWATLAWCYPKTHFKIVRLMQFNIPTDSSICMIPTELDLSADCTNLQLWVNLFNVGLRRRSRPKTENESSNFSKESAWLRVQAQALVQLSERIQGWRMCFECKDPIPIRGQSKVILNESRVAEATYAWISCSSQAK